MNMLNRIWADVIQNMVILLWSVRTYKRKEVNKGERSEKKGESDKKNHLVIEIESNSSGRIQKRSWMKATPGSWETSSYIT